MTTNLHYSRQPMSVSLVLLRTYLRDVVASRGLGDRLCQSATSVGFVFTDLGEGVVWQLYSDSRRGVSSGSGREAEIVLEMNSALAASLFAGASNMWQEVALGNVVVTGPVEKVNEIWPAMEFAGGKRFAAARMAADPT
jgi:hypothetical protein